tara:strand:+ start:523 stop:840 length:318 start_codon:yes stop_codon:yes gene_type:complete
MAPDAVLRNKSRILFKQMAPNTLVAALAALITTIVVRSGSGGINSSGLIHWIYTQTTIIEIATTATTTAIATTKCPQRGVVEILDQQIEQNPKNKTHRWHVKRGK